LIVAVRIFSFSAENYILLCDSNVFIFVTEYSLFCAHYIELSDIFFMTKYWIIRQRYCSSICICD